MRCYNRIASMNSTTTRARSGQRPPRANTFQVARARAKAALEAFAFLQVLEHGFERGHVTREALVARRLSRHLATGVRRLFCLLNQS